MKKATIKIIYLYALIAMFAPSAWANCIYNGKTYPTGTKLGELTCQPDGTWK